MNNDNLRVAPQYSPHGKLEAYKIEKRSPSPRRKAHIEALEFVLGVAFEVEISRATREGDMLILATDTPIETPQGWQRVK